MDARETIAVVRKLRPGWRWVLVLVLVLVGCGAATTTATTVGTDDACGARTGLVVEAPEVIAGTWNEGSVIVGGTGTVTVRWCGEGTVVVERTTGMGSAGSAWELAYDPAAATLAHGDAVSHDVPGPAVPSVIELTAYATTAAGTPIRAHGRIRGELPALFVAERDACLADGGTWGPVGLAQTFACDRPTHDAGQRCLSRADCEGPCVDDHHEVPTTPPDGRTCPAGQEVRLHVGTCASHTLMFGCAPRLDDVLTECVAPGMASRSHTVCVD